MARRRTVRNLLIVIASLIVLLVLIAALAPTIISRGPGPGWVASAVEKRINGTAGVKSLDLSWFGGQTLRGLTITDTDGKQAASLDLSLNASLLQLIFGLPDRITLGVSGTLDGELREDGSISFRELMKPQDQAAEDERDEAAGAPSLAGVPGVTLNVDELVVEFDFRTDAGDLLDATTRATLSGRGVYEPGGEAKLTLAGPVTTRSRSDESALREGRIDLDTTFGKLFNDAGVMTPAGATLRTTLTASDLPVPFTEQVSAVKRFEIEADADDLTDRIAVRIDGESAHGEAGTSTLSGKLTFLQPITSDGQPQFALERISGLMEGKRVPTVLAQALVAETPFRLTRDVGEWADITAEFSPGETRDISVTLTADRARLRGEAVVDADGSIRGSSLEATVEVQPELVRALVTEPVDDPGSGEAGGTPWAIASPAVVRLTATEFAIPPRATDGTRRLADLSFTGAVVLEASVPLVVSGDAEKTITIADARIDFDASSLADGVEIDGRIDADDGRVTIDQTLSGLIDEEGGLALGAAVPVGTITVQHPDGTRIAAQLPENQLGSTLRELLNGEVNATIETARDETGLRAALRATTGMASASLAAVRSDEALRIESARLEATVPPDLIATLQDEADEDERIGLTEPAHAIVALRPIELSGRTFDDYLGAAASLAAEVTLMNASLTHASLNEPLAVRELTGAATIGLGDAPSYSFNGSGSLFRDTERQTTSAVRLDIAAETVDGRLVPRGTIEVQDLSIAQVERILGAEPGRYVSLLGSSGGVKVILARDQADRDLTIETSLPNLEGSIRAASAEDSLRLTSDELTFIARKPLLDRFLAPERDEGTDERSEATPTRALHAASDVSVTLALNELRIPPALAKGDSFDPKTVKLKASAKATPLEVADETGIVSTLRDLSLALETNDLAQGVSIRVDGKAATRGKSQPGDVSVTGTWDRLIAEDGTFAPDAGGFTLQTSARHVPTALADALLGLGGSLAAAVGDEMSARFESKDFSPDSGWLDGRIDATNGFIEGIVKGREGALLNTRNRPVEGELRITPALRQRLLRPIHPVLADIRSTEHPIRFRVPQRLVLPLDGDVSRLDADLEIEVGAVAFDSGSITLALLTLFEERAASVPGSIDPIRVKVRDGIITYDRFTMHIGKYDLAWEGRIDLTKRTLDLRTELPLAALAMTFEELEGYADRIIVPIVTRGTIGDPQTMIDPEFDIAAAALEAGFRGALDEFFRDKVLPGGGIFDDIFRRLGEERRHGDRK